MTSHFATILFAIFLHQITTTDRDCPIYFVEEGGVSLKGVVEIRAAAMPAGRGRLTKYGTHTTQHSKDATEAQGSELSNVVVSLKRTDGTMPIKSPSERPILDQRDAVFIPHVLPILKGTTVYLTNQDKTYHNVFSLSPVRRFNIGRRPTGEAVPVDFPTPGIVQVFCDIHSHMSAFIVVLETPYFTKPNRRGEFTVEQVVPGTYEVSVWHERYSAPSQTIIVTDKGRSDVRFILE